MLWTPTGHATHFDLDGGTLPRWRPGHHDRLRDRRHRNDRLGRLQRQRRLRLGRLQRQRRFRERRLDELGRFDGERRRPGHEQRRLDRVGWLDGERRLDGVGRDDGEQRGDHRQQRRGDGEQRGTTGSSGGTTGAAGHGSGGTTGSSGGTTGSSGGTTGSAGTTGAAGTTGSAGASGTGFGQPVCGNNSAGTAIGKGIACTSTDPQLCYKTCGPASIGAKSETCSSAMYAEAACGFDPSQSYACYKIPTTMDPTCPTTPPMASSACPANFATCVVCNVGGMYLDSKGTSQTGYCVCQASGKWTCASTTAWPCPGNTGC